MIEVIAVDSKPGFKDDLRLDRQIAADAHLGQRFKDSREGLYKTEMDDERVRDVDTRVEEVLLCLCVSAPGVDPAVLSPPAKDTARGTR